MVSADELALMVKNGQLSQLREYGGTEALAAKLNCFDVNKGLDSETTDFEEIKKRYGKNELQPPFVPRYLSLVYENLQDATIILLIIAAIVSLILGIAFEEDKSTAWIEGAAILVAVAFVVNFQAWTDYNNAKTFRNQFYDLESAKRVNVLRDGRLQVIHPTDLVVGDILRLETGAIVAADGVLVDGRALKLDEAALTGESKQFAKQPFDMSKAMTDNQPSPFILSGTSVVNGEGRMLVVAVGPNSLQGKILTTVIQQDDPAAEQTRGSSHALNPPSLHSIQSSKRRETDLSVLKEHEPLDASGSGVEVDVELPHVDVKPFLTNSNRGQSVRSTQFSLRSDKNMTDHESQSYTNLTKFAVPRKRRYDRIPCARASSTVTGRNLTEKLDKLAIDIGKFGFAIATIVFIVMCIRWSVEEFVDQGSCPLFNGNYTLCSTDAKLLGCSMDINLNATCTRVWNGANDFSQLLRFFITAVTILVVVVPEGLPLAVTLSLSLSMRRMAKENNQVKNMDSSETMGSATTVCTDKTGTLTENRMTCVRLLLADKEFRGDYSKTLGAQLQASSELTYQVNLLLNACSLATNPASSTSGGNATDAALLRMTQQAEFDWAGIRASAKPDNPSADWGVCYYPFSSTRKRCSVVVRNSDGSYRVFSIGAPQYVLETCTSVLRGTAATSPYDESAKKEIDKKIQDFAHDALRTIAISYKDMAAPPVAGWESPANGYESVDGQVLVYAIEQGLTLLAIVGIEDPLRPGIKEAIAKCYSAGVDVRMCTGDALETAVAISLQCGILRPTDMETDENGRLIPKPMFAMTGAEFDERIHMRDNDKPRVWRRAYDFKTNKFGEMKAPPFKVDSRGQKILNKKAFDEIWPKLRVLARCLPEDKLTLVKGLKGSDLFLRPDKVAELKQKHGIIVYPDFQVVAVTGDGTNDAPALKSADVGFAMGIAGTDIAKQACDIILLDDNFSSIVTAIKWGRNVFDSISKFVQFQLTVNLVAVVVASVGAFAFSRSPLGPVQMLWVNLIMDSFASFALATDLPSETLLDRPPYGKRRPIVSFIMGFNIVGQAGFQIALLMGLLFNASWIPDSDWTVGAVPKYPPSESSVLLDAVLGQVHVDDGVSVHWTIIFNAFVMLQLANQVNCRKLQTIHRLRTTWSEWNPLERICSNWLFNVIILLELGGQIIIVQLAGKTFTVTALSLSQWVFCLGLGLLSFLWQWVLNIAVILIDEFTTKKSSAERLQPVVGSHRDLVVQPEEA